MHGQCQNGMTVLHLAAQKGNLQIVVLVLAAGGSVTALNGVSGVGFSETSIGLSMMESVWKCMCIS